MPIPPQIEDMRRVLKFIVDEEAAPAADGAGRVETYLAAAHRLKKVVPTLLLHTMPGTGSEASFPPLCFSVAPNCLALFG